MRANILTQIRANEQAQARKNQPADVPRSRSLIINNHQDTNQPLYVNEPAAPTAGALPAPSPAAPTPAATAPAAPPLRLNAIEFGSGSDQLLAKSWPTLRTLANQMTQPDVIGYPFLVIGHTDNKGSAAANLVLSQRRARSVVTALGMLGIEPARLRPLGLGMTSPIEGLKGSDPSNRRVEVILDTARR